jgi:hypothetical protein
MWQHSRKNMCNITSSHRNARRWGIINRITDLDLDANHSKLFVRGEYTKTKADRIVFMTQEVTQQLKSWIDYKYRTRKVCH